MIITEENEWVCVHFSTKVELCVGVVFANTPNSAPFPITIVCAIGAAGERSVRREGTNVSCCIYTDRR